MWSTKRTKGKRLRQKYINHPENKGLWFLQKLKEEYGNTDTFKGIYNIIDEYKGRPIFKIGKMIKDKEYETISFTNKIKKSTVRKKLNKLTDEEYEKLLDEQEKDYCNYHCNCSHYCSHCNCSQCHCYCHVCHNCHCYVCYSPPPSPDYSFYDFH